MTGKENRYSIDGSYDLDWNRKFPLDGDLLWPSGRLLQLQWLLTFGDLAGEVTEWRHMLILEKTKVITADAGENCPFSLSGNPTGTGYKFCTGTMTRVREFSTIDIERVTLRTWTGNPKLSIRLGEGLGEKNSVISFYNFPLSAAMYDIAEAAIAAGIVSPEPRLMLTKAMEKRALMEQLLCREIVRQFRRASPNAEIVLKGEHMPGEVFQRIIR